MKYVADGSTMFWAVGTESSVIAKQEFCGKEVEMVVPFEGSYSGEVQSAVYIFNILKHISVMVYEYIFSIDLTFDQNIFILL